MENNELKEKIRENVKEKIAILNIRNEFDMKETNKNTRKYLNIAVMFLIIVLAGAVGTQIYAKINWNIEFKKYQNREYVNGSGRVREAFENGYGENIDMDYIEQDKIKAKVDSLIVTDDYFASNINFEFPEDMKLNSETFEFGWVVYDENNNIYGMASRYHYSNPVKVETYWRYLYKEIGKKENYIDLLCTKAGILNVKAVGNNIISEINIYSNSGFPKSKKIYIRVYDLGYHMFEMNENVILDGEKADFQLSNSEWIFEIDVPEKFYERKVQELKLVETIPEIEITKFYATELATVLNIKSKELIKQINSEPGSTNANNWLEIRNNSFYITDENGNRYDEDIYYTSGKKDTVITGFPITKEDMLNKKYFLNLKISDKLYTVEIMKIDTDIFLK